MIIKRAGAGRGVGLVIVGVLGRVYLVNAYLALERDYRINWADVRASRIGRFSVDWGPVEGAMVSMDWLERLCAEVVYGGCKMRGAWWGIGAVPTPLTLKSGSGALSYPFYAWCPVFCFFLRM